jgi:membrane protease YdiL (CAAX protease family)
MLHKQGTEQFRFCSRYPRHFNAIFSADRSQISSAQKEMKKKVLYAYIGLLLLVWLSYLFPGRFFDFLLPFFLLAVPFFLTGRLNAAFSLKQISLGFAVAAALILPLFILLPGFFTLSGITVPAVLIQFFMISIPEEVFFRGFVQDVLGNDLKGVIIVSLMFSAAHFPALLLYGDLSAPLTFFPSMVMGLLYMKTSNVLPSAVFHLASNLAFTGFNIQHLYAFV